MFRVYGPYGPSARSHRSVVIQVVGWSVRFSIRVFFGWSVRFHQVFFGWSVRFSITVFFGWSVRFSIRVFFISAAGSACHVQARSEPGDPETPLPPRPPPRYRATPAAPLPPSCRWPRGSRAWPTCGTAGMRVSVAILRLSAAQDFVNRPSCSRHFWRAG